MRSGGVTLITELPIIERVIQMHSADLGADLMAYRNHTYRVVNFCLALFPAEFMQLEKLSTAAAFHDLGIWTHHTFDYLKPSVGLACAHLIGTGQDEWSAEITEMILQHHKLFPYRRHPQWLVEPLRRADLVDVSAGLVTFGLPRELIREIYATWPTEGFHKRLVQLELARLRRYPWNPLPMVRL